MTDPRKKTIAAEKTVSKQTDCHTSDIGHWLAMTESFETDKEF